MFLFSKRISIAFILKIFLLSKIKINLFKKKYLFNNQKLILFNRSRWSLLFIVFLYKKFYQKNQVNIWVPSYYCNYALSKIRNHYKEVKFIFYPINESLNFEINELTKINAKHSIDIFIKVNYFGKDLNNLELTNFLYKNNSWLINDCTHCINPERTRTPMRVKNFGNEPEDSLLKSVDVAKISVQTLLSDLTGQVVYVKR